MIMTYLTNSAKASAITTVLFNKGMTPKYAMVVAAALIENQINMAYGMDRFMEEMELSIYNTNMTVAGEMTSCWSIDGFIEMLISCDLVTDEGAPGEYLIKLDEEKPKAKPLPASATRIARSRPAVPGVKSTKLMDKAINALQETQYEVDTYILELATKVFPNPKDCDESFVLDGCRVLVADGNVPVTAEFFGDRRGRLYQGDAHGPNGQSSDMSRALMNLSNVATDYDAFKALKVIEAELADMIKGNLADAEKLVKTYKSASAFIIDCLSGRITAIKKPWSFIKAMKIRALIKKGQKPYIGMAFGLDAKCSGPQLGALMTNDQGIAAACGMTNTVVADAYAIGSESVKAAGFGIISRDLIKKPYMGIFYGQGKQAFSFIENFNTTAENTSKKLLPYELLLVINSGPGADLEENGQEFHAAIERSFGNMLALRAAIRKAHYTYDDNMNMVMLTNEATSHFMPDGLEVKMAYRHKVDIEGVEVAYDSLIKDVVVELGLTRIEFKEMKLQTKNTNLYDFARAGFVNLIQASDALLARLIVSNLEELQAQHIIAVHDCFRVNIHDMINGKLHAAIEMSYMDMFGNTKNEPTRLLPRGTDIMKMYFEGVNAAGADCAEPSQFMFSPRTQEDVRITRYIGKDSLPSLICNMENALTGKGNSYYFAK
jgi:hypothetical protein